MTGADHVGSKNKFFKLERKHIIVLAAEAVILLICLMFCFTAKDKYSFGPDEFDIVAGSRDSACVKIDDSYDFSGHFAECRGIHLGRGSYSLRLKYTADTDGAFICDVSDATASRGNLWANYALLYSGLSNTDLKVWLWESTDELTISVSSSDAGSIKVYGLDIYETNDLQKFVFVTVLFVFILFDGLCIAYIKTENSTENRKVIFALVITVIIGSITLFTDYLATGDDLGYHLLRIEGIKDGLLAGQFPVRLYPEWLLGYGYDDSLMYGNSLLYIPALLELLGLPLMMSYKAYVFIVNCMTVAVAFYVFRRISSDSKIGLAATVLYTMSPYRLYCVYHRASVGEYSAMVFTPLIILGMFLIYTEDKDAEERRTGVFPLVIGLTGIINSHVLTCEMVGGLIVLFCIVEIRRTFRKGIFLQLLKSLGITIALNLFFLVPFAECFLKGNLKIGDTIDTIQKGGIYIANFFAFLINDGGNDDPRYYNVLGMKNFLPTTPGLALVLVIILFVFVLWIRKKEDKDRTYRYGVIATAFSVLVLFLSTELCPWDSIQKLNPLFLKLVSSLQFPMRFLAIAIPLMTLSFVFVAQICKKKDKRVYAAMMISLLVIALVSGIYQQNSLLNKVNFYRLYDVDGMGSLNAMGQEYLPVGTDINQLRYGHYAVDGVEIDNVVKKYTTVSFDASSASGGYVEVPLIKYIGYAAKDSMGNKLPLEYGNNNVIRVIVPDNYSGKITVYYAGNRYWRIAELISLVTLILMIIYRLGCIDKVRERLSGDANKKQDNRAKK